MFCLIIKTSNATKLMNAVFRNDALVNEAGEGERSNDLSTNAFVK